MADIIPSQYRAEKDEDMIVLETDNGELLINQKYCSQPTKEDYVEELKCMIQSLWKKENILFYPC